MTKSIATIDQLRELVELQLNFLALARRSRKEHELQRDKAAAKAQAVLDAIVGPFQPAIAELKLTETEALSSAVETLCQWVEARRAELVAGRECTQPVNPPGVSISWKDHPTITDPDCIPTEFLELAPNMGQIKEALLRGTEIPGAEMVRIPTVTVKGDGK